ncbi:hypothetical protein [Bradyrhizobium commune]|uniref:O-antigen ligase domain-containing protein n=1 Tax=Bradyrhizobium commune TaxID=83627 RepID=A0A7S9D4J3_9BRAD|nr:hypothetical protein [Bradyrhizobium commune]QPF90289.1 hypothetical protein IC761_27890 [Bradyrhizobium commune]
MVALIAGGVFVEHAAYLLASLTLGCAAAASSAASVVAVVSRLRRFVPAMVFPIIWMLMQIVPISTGSVANPIWSATALALNEPSLRGHISIDAGSTLGSLIWYLTILSTIVSTVVLTMDRARAETTLFALTAVATLIVLTRLACQTSVVANLGLDIRAARALPTVGPIAALGGVAMIAMAVERNANRAGSDTSFIVSLLPQLLLSIAGIVSALMLMTDLNESNLLALTVLGFAVIALVAIVRRLRVPAWSSAILAGILVSAVAAAMVSLAQTKPTLDLLSAVEKTTGQGSLAIMRRILTDSSWLGGGVGTFDQISRVYLDYGAHGAPPLPSTAALVVVEWGRLALPILIAFSLQLFFYTVNGAVSRGRDSFFASATAAVVIVAMGEAFVDPGMLNPPIQLLLAGMVGLGISQSMGKTKV